MATFLKSGIDICICTYNRVDFLMMNINELLPQLVPGHSVITVVDNNSEDGTNEYMHSLIKTHPSIRYLIEKQQGLSRARNKGWEESEYEWIFYIDDDCKPESTLVREALVLTETHPEFDALGGPIESIFIDSPPAWLPDGFGNFSIPAEKVIPLPQGYLRGGCFLVKRSVLSRLNGFNPSLGMTGNTMQYSEELEFQFRMRKSGYQIGYAPTLRMPHFVRTEKVNLTWLLKSEYVKRRDKMFFDPISFPKATLHLFRTMAGRVVWVPIYFYRMMIKKKYKWQNFVLDTFIPLAYRTGEWIGVLKQSFL